MFITQLYSFIIVNHVRKGSLINAADSEFGVSFIGQDVCGSRYNDDPFAEIDRKQSSWEEFQERVKAIEDKYNNKTGNSTVSSGK